MRFTPLRLALVAGTALTAITPALAQDAADTGSANDIVVTARRTEERLQDVPISITVFNQQQLADKNLVGAAQLATYTPSLSANDNFGGDNTTFAIRGFVQDIGTAPSVGTYFGDVVAPRGASNGVAVGDGASVGNFFDLQNVQVLKGPQGTLFGRNTTGGAVLFVPTKPTDKLEGYLEGSYGNYSMKRVQAMINVPVNDTFKVRIAFDHMDRKGYLNNISGIGPSRFGDVDYYAARVSVVADLTPTLQNYVIVSYSQSNNNGSLNKLVAADATQGPFGQLAAAQLARQQAAGGFYTVENAQATYGLKTEQWQIINNTTWRASDSITVHNIASYAQLLQRGVNPIFGNRFIVPTTVGTYNADFQTANSAPNLRGADEATITEEFRLEGTGTKFNWQAGAYTEFAEPLSQSGSQSPGFASCRDGNGATFQCNDPIRQFTAEEIAGIAQRFLGQTLTPTDIFNNGVPQLQIRPLPSFGNINYTVAKTRFRDVGLYAQGTYSLTDQLKVTGGIRYTWDKESIDTVQRSYILVPPPAYGTSPYVNPTTGAVQAYKCFQGDFAAYPACTTRFSLKSDAPTWLIDVDYTPVQNVLLYAKYARGYRAAVIVPVIPISGTVTSPDFGLNYVKQEKVDAYEAGFKTSFGGTLRGTLNAAGFYNKFSNQQLQVGFLPRPGLEGLFAQTAAPVNAGKSTIYGAEVEASLRPFEGLALSASYTYLHTRIDQVLALPTSAAYITQNAFKVGDPEVLTPKHKLAVNANYTLPLDASVGKITVGGTFTYRSSFLSNYIDRTNPNPALAQYGTIRSLSQVDLNASWDNVAGSPFDIGAFVTNLTKRRYYAYTPGLGSTQLGFEDATVGEPRFFGGRIRYHFSN